MVGKNSTWNTMNFFVRFWYSVYEFVSKKSAYQDTPYFGTAFVLTFIIAFWGIAFMGYWMCISCVYPDVPEPPDLIKSRMDVAVILTPVFTAFWLLGKIKRHRWIEAFRNESEPSKRKRVREALTLMGAQACFFVGSVIWRALQ